MPSANTKNSNKKSAEERLEDKAQERNLDIRTALNDAQAFLLGRQTVESFKALTYEELLDDQIERISGSPFNNRPNELERIDRMEQRVLAAIAEVSSRPPEDFVLPDEEEDVNT